MKRILTALVFIMFLSACSSEVTDISTETPEPKYYQLYLDLHSEINIIFDTYDISVVLDSTDLGSIPNGKTFATLLDVEEGKHTLTLHKAGDTSVSATHQLSINSDTTFSCDIKHGSSLTLKNLKTVDNVNISALPVPNLVGEILSDARKQLDDTGFANVSYEGLSGEIWDYDNWIVTEQSISEGETLDKYDEIHLICKHLDEYYSEAFTGKTVAEIEKMAEENWYSVEFEDDSYNDLTEKIAGLSKAAKEQWICEKARHKSFAEKTAYVMIKQISSSTVASDSDKKSETQKESDEKEENITTENNKPKADETPVQTKSPYYFYSGTKETVQDGNTGIYAYSLDTSNYEIYFIIDFDDGYLYRFISGDWDSICDKVKIVEGDLNHYILITYHDGDSSFSEGFHFKRQRIPDILIYEDSSHSEFTCYPAGLDNALKIRETKEIVDYSK